MKGWKWRKWPIGAGKERLVDGCRNGRGRGMNEREREGKGWEIMVEMGVIRGGVMVRTNTKKSSKKWFFIQNLPPLQNGKCYQSAPDNCDYMVNLIPSPYIPIGKLGYKAIPTKPIGIQGIWQLLEMSCFCNFSRVYITIFFFSGINSALFPSLNLTFPLHLLLI